MPDLNANASHTSTAASSPPLPPPPPVVLGGRPVRGSPWVGIAPRTSVPFASWFVLGVAIVALVGSLVLAGPGVRDDDGEPSQTEGRIPLVCPVRVVGDTPCPTCGTTRAFRAMGRGEPSVAWQYHPMAVLAYLFLVGYIGYFGVSTVGRWRIVFSPRAGRVILFAFLASLLGLWIGRMLAGTLPT